MKRLHYCGTRTLLLLYLASLLASGALAADQPTFRDLARKYVKDGDGTELAKLIGYSEPVKKVIALEYKVLLLVRDQSGKLVEKPVDPKAHEFKVGDKVRLAIEPISDYYVYIFTIAASGDSYFLLPEEGEELTMVKGGTTIALPDDGFIEFCEPPGEETVLVVATEKPVTDRDVLARVLSKKPGQQDTPEEQAVRKTLKATVKKALKSVRERQQELLDKTVMYRGLTTEDQMQELARDVRTRGVTEGTFEEPTPNVTGGTSAMYVSMKAEEEPRLLVSIPLKSVASKREKP